MLAFHVHGSWMTSFVAGPHTVAIPVLDGRPPDGRGRARTWRWPSRAVEVTPAELAELEPDVVVLQRPHEAELVEVWTGRRPGRDLPAVYVEHDAPTGDVACMRHHLADRDDLTIVHVSHWNAMHWDVGTAQSVVIEHGVALPEVRATYELDAAAVLINEPTRRGRVVGTDLLPELERLVPLRIFGMGTEPLGGLDLPQHEVHRQMARCRMYLHPYRCTSLGLSLLEAMGMGLPVVGLSTTEAAEVVTAEAGVISNDRRKLADGIRGIRQDPTMAAEMGAAGRRLVTSRFGLHRFLDDWDDVLRDAIGRRRQQAA